MKDEAFKAIKKNPAILKEKKTAFGTPQEIDWEEVKNAVKDMHKDRVEKLGKQYQRPALQQEGVSAEEVVKQILSQAPGSPLVGPLLLDLASKL